MLSQIITITLVIVAIFLLGKVAVCFFPDKEIKKDLGNYYKKK